MAHSNHSFINLNVHLVTICEPEKVFKDGGSAEVDHPAGVAQLLVQSPSGPIGPSLGVATVTDDMTLEMKGIIWRY